MRSVCKTATHVGKGISTVQQKGDNRRTYGLVLEQDLLPRFIGHCFDCGIRVLEIHLLGPEQVAHRNKEIRE